MWDVVTVLLLFGHPPEVFGSNCQEGFQLGHTVFGDVTCGESLFGFVEQAQGFLMVSPRHIECVFQRCVVYQNRFAFHASILVRFPD